MPLADVLSASTGSEAAFLQLKDSGWESGLQGPRGRAAPCTAGAAGTAGHALLCSVLSLLLVRGSRWSSQSFQSCNSVLSALKNQKVVNAELEGERWATTFHVPVFGAEQNSRGQAESSFCQCVVAQTLGVK